MISALKIKKKYLYPATESNVVPILKKLKRIWIDPYTRIAGEDFIKGAAPRQISLIGSWLVNEENGTITLGFADSGMKITHLKDGATIELPKNDPRRELQLPDYAIKQGLTANPR